MPHPSPPSSTTAPVNTASPADPRARALSDPDRPYPRRPPAAAAPELVLTPEQKHALSSAARNWRAVCSAARLAGFNAGFLALAAGLSTIVAFTRLAGALTAGPAAIFGELGGVVLAAALIAVTTVEYTGRKKLLAMNPAGPSMLAWNQIALLAIIVVYCCSQIYASVHGPSAYQQALDQNPELANVLGPIGNLYGVLSFAIYGAVIAASFVFQGLCAWYYYKRIALVRQWLDQTPTWIADLIRILN